MSGWAKRPFDPALEELRAKLDGLPPELAWEALLHYYAHIHSGRPARVLLIDSWNWRTGRHLYFVPVPHERDVAQLRNRHLVARADAFSTEIVELHWGEFERRFPRPASDVLTFKRLAK